LASAGSYKLVVKLLLAKGVNVNAQSYNYNILSIASEAGSKKVVKLLLNNGANVNALGNKYSNTL
jgi:ankyrin repeat protein